MGSNKRVSYKAHYVKWGDKNKKVVLKINDIAYISFSYKTIFLWSMEFFIYLIIFLIFLPVISLILDIDELFRIHCATLFDN